MHVIHLSLRMANGARQALQLVARSSAEALQCAQDLFGEQLRGGSAIVLRAPGLVLDADTSPGRVLRTAANDMHYAEGRA